ncbi:MAG: hypothetical protein OEM02_02205, partial [Desulfobulbaceae bacterium]|nr:hypothetical protein [Desulfobulbaceae bacterium]
MSLTSTDDQQFEAGLALLAKPIAPLARIVQMLYLTGPFETISDVLQELHEPIETNHAVYDDPSGLLLPHLDLLQEFERLKHPRAPLARILDEQENPIEPMEALALYVSQQLLTRELETINSLLCAPCGCTLCCVGPNEQQTQEFFEIPLKADEVTLFPLAQVDNHESRRTSPYQEPPLARDSRPFYQTESAIYHWRDGW